MQKSPESQAPVSAKSTGTEKSAALAFDINGKPYFHDGDKAMPLLWYLRDILRLTGTKYGCGIG